MCNEGPWSIESRRVPGQYPDEGQTDVWLCSCGAPGDILRRYVATFDESEKVRAASFRVMHAWSAFVARRAMVRMVASRYLGVPGGDIQWGTGPMAKPVLRTRTGRSCLEFSWSQTGATVVIAVACGVPVGVDACYEREGEDLDGFADVFCSKDEASALERLTGHQRVHAVVRCWTSKEACLKAAGTGLRCDPRRLRTWGDDRPLDTVEWREGGTELSRRRMAVAHQSMPGKLDVAIAAPIPLALKMHRLVWNGGDDHGL